LGTWTCRNLGKYCNGLFIAPYLKDKDFSLGSQLVAQIEAVLLTIVYSGIMTAIIYFIASELQGVEELMMK